MTDFKYNSRYIQLRKHLKTHIVGEESRKSRLPPIDVHHEDVHRTPVKSDSVWACVRVKYYVLFPVSRKPFPVRLSTPMNSVQYNQSFLFLPESKKGYS